MKKLISLVMVTLIVAFSELTIAQMVLENNISKYSYLKELLEFDTDTTDYTKKDSNNLSTRNQFDSKVNKYLQDMTKTKGMNKNSDRVKSNILSDSIQIDWVANYAAGLKSPEDFGNAVVSDASGYIYVTGRSNNDYLTIKYDASGVEQWEARYNGPNNSFDAAADIAVDGSGNVYVTGTSGISPDYHYTTIKYNSAGAEQWVSSYDGGNSNNQAVAIAVDISGNVYVTGRSRSVYSEWDYATVKYSNSGVELWNVKYNGTGNNVDYSNGIDVDQYGNVYITGSSIGKGTSYDYATIKYNSSGVEQWVARYNGVANYGDFARDLVVDNSGNVYVTGSSSVSNNFSDYATIKYNSGGNVEWISYYNGPLNYYDDPVEIAIDDSGDVFVTGTSESSDFATVKYNSSGLEQWVAIYNGQGNSTDYASGLSLDSYGNVYVTGLSDRSGNYDYDYATVKYNASGVEQWISLYNGPGDFQDWPYSISVDNLGNICVTGESRGPNDDYDYATVKYNTFGNEQWVSRYDGPGLSADVPVAIVLDDFGNVIVTGSSFDSNSDYDFATLKYNTLGEVLWVTRYNGLGNGSDYAVGIAVDYLGNLYVAGSSWGLDTDYDYTVVKYNSSGAEQWTARYNGPGDSTDQVTALTVDSAGNIYVTGYSAGIGSAIDYATVKYNFSGIEQWVARYNDSDDLDDRANAISVKNGNVYITGSSHFFCGEWGCFGGYCTTICYNEMGEELWEVHYAEYPSNGASSIAIDDSENVYVTGSCGESGWGTYYSNFLTLKYNSAGVEQWSVVYNNAGNYNYNKAIAIALDDLSNVYVAGSSVESNWPLYSDYTTVKYDPSGTEQWIATFSGPGNSNNEVTALVLDESGNVYVTGRSGNYPDVDYATIKYNSMGVEQWIATYNGSGNFSDIATAITLDNSGNIYVAGSTTFDGGIQYTTIKYKQVLGGVPIELTTFTATAQNNTVELNWTTATEINNQGFEIQRSTSISEFITVGFVEGHGTTTEEHHYTYKDKDVSGLLRYRLKQVDFDGSFEYSDIAEVEALGITSYVLAQNYPNPFNPITNISYTLPTESQVKLSVYNPLGELVETLVNEKQSAGKYDAIWNASNYPSGVYIYTLDALSVNGDEQTKLSKKMLLLK